MPWLYGVALLANAGRVAGRDHWVSDTVGGAFLGYAIGRSMWESHRRVGQGGPSWAVLPDGIAGFQSCERKQFTYQPVHPLDVGMEACRQLGALLRRPLDQVGGNLQPGQWRTQLVGHVVQQAPLAVHERLQARGHPAHMPDDVAFGVDFERFDRHGRGHGQRQPLL